MNLSMKQRLTDIENKLRVTKGDSGRDKLGVWYQQIQTTIYKIDKQQGPTVQHRELYSIPCNKPYGKEDEDYIYIYIYIYIYENHFAVHQKLIQHCKSTKKLKNILLVSGICPGMGLLDHMVALFLVF